MIAPLFFILFSWSKFELLSLTDVCKNRYLLVGSMSCRKQDMTIDN
jgi:hypothetical protein